MGMKVNWMMHRLIIKNPSNQKLRLVSEREDEHQKMFVINAIDHFQVHKTKTNTIAMMTNKSQTLTQNQMIRSILQIQKIQTTKNQKHKAVMNMLIKIKHQSISKRSNKKENQKQRIQTKMDRREQAV